MMPTNTPTYPQYTNLALGEGLFDQLMVSVKQHIKEEYDAQRIRGDVYASTYLGSIEAVLQNTTQYLLGILLLDEKKAQLAAQTKLTELQMKELQFKIDNLYPLELEKVRQELLKIEAEVLLTNAQIDKINKEIEFMDAKIATEKTNVDATDINPVSVIGRQMELLRAQKLGFAGDLEAKVAKLNADYATTVQTVHEFETALSLDANTVKSINFMLETVEKIKDETYVDEIFTPFAPPVVVAP